MKPRKPNPETPYNFAVRCYDLETAKKLDAFIGEQGLNRIAYLDGYTKPPRRQCKHHPEVDYLRAWGCPDCLAELRTELRELKRKIRAFVRAETGDEIHETYNALRAVK